MAPPLFQRVADAFAATQDAVAVDGPGGRYTFAELARWADGAVQQLTAQQVGRGEPVGLCFDQSPALLAAILGVLKHGAALVPLNPGLPTERLRAIVAGAGCRVTLADPAHAGRLPAGHTVLPPPAADAPPQPPGDAGLDDLAYLHYPEGVAVTHRNVLALVDGLRALDIGAEDRVAGVMDPAMAELWAPWCAGATVVVAPRQAAPDPAAIAKLVAEHRVTTLFAPTGLFRLMAAQEPAGMTGIRLVVVGGEAADSLSVHTIQQDSRPDRIVGVHGHGGTAACVFEFPPDWPAGNSPVPAGRPLPGLRAHVLDGELRPVPDGEDGELYVGGEGVAIGYHRAAGRTADRFVPDPDAHAPGRRLFRTGDLVRRERDGELVLVGHTDGRVTIGDHRVALTEIDGALTAEPAVTAACAAVREPQRLTPAEASAIAFSRRPGARRQAPGDRRVVAAVVGGADLDLDQVRDRVRARLPEFMVPAQLVAVDALPLTADGTADRAAVAALVAAGVPERSAAAPDGLMARIAAAWAETLGHDVEPDENFFDAGGDSLLLLQLNARLDQRLGREIPLLDLLEFPTVAGLATHLDAAFAQEG